MLTIETRLSNSVSAGLVDPTQRQHVHPYLPGGCISEGRAARSFSSCGMLWERRCVADTEGVRFSLGSEAVHFTLMTQRRVARAMTRAMRSQRRRAVKNGSRSSEKVHCGD